MLSKNNMPKMAYLAMGLPALIYIFVFFKYVNNMPYFDDYEAILAWTLEFFNTHGFRGRFLLLLQQHNEHRIIIDYFANLLSVALFHRLNFVFIGLVGSIGLFGIVATMILIGTRSGLSVYELISIPVLLLSLSQYELLLEPMAAVQQYWQLLMVILSILLLTTSLNKIRFCLACFTAIMATFSGGGGLLIFPVGLLYLTLTRKWPFTICWLLVTGITLYLFFIYFDYKPEPSDTLARAFFLANPLSAAKFTLSFIGNYGRSILIAIVSGMLSIATIAVLLITNFKRLNVTLLCICLFLFLSAIVVALNRAVYGLSASLGSRYTIYGLLDAAIVYMLAISCIRAKAARCFLNILIIFISIFVYVSWLNPGLSALRYNHNAEKTGLIAWPGDPSRAWLKTAMQENLFYPKILYRHLPAEIENNSQYDHAWNQLFELYLVRPDLWNAFPLGNAASYEPLVHWAANGSTNNDPGYAELVAFRLTYQSMLGVFKH